MEFEFDAAKSIANAQKHGIDFLRAQDLWLDEMRLEIPARTEDEAHWLLVAKVDGKHWAAIYARRAGGIRIISVRRARAEERAWYEGENA